jgi:hypothetical protein
LFQGQFKNNITEFAKDNPHVFVTGIAQLSKSSIYWTGVFASLEATLRHNKFNCSEMAKVASTVVPIIDKAFDLLFADDTVMSDRHVGVHSFYCLLLFESTFFLP